jgi:pimeloyl-ACP methyl ester carboxylesterase
MQFAYQFPQLVERLVLVGTGGITRDVNLLLRFAALPVGGEALALLRLPMVLPALQLAGRATGLVFGSTGWDATCPTSCGCLPRCRNPTPCWLSPEPCVRRWIGAAR